MTTYLMFPDSAAQRTGEAQVAVPEPTALALKYYRTGNLLWAIETGLGLLIPALLLFSGFSARLRDFAFRWGRRWLFAVMLYGACLVVITAILTVPLAYYSDFIREHGYGLSNQSFQKWAGDWLKSVVLSALGLALILWIPYLLLRRSPRRWWLYAGLAALPIGTFVLVVSPVWVDPLFNDFGPLRDRQLESRILQLARRAGIPESRVYQVNKSVDTRTVNAYVAGVGRTKRIVLWDTILSKLSPDQVAFVMAHEMGHFVLHHVLTLIAAATLLVLLSLYLVHRVAGRLIERFSSRLGFDRLSDLASFPLLLLLGGLVALATTPLILALNRHQEHEADQFALELTRDNRAAATTFVRLQEENLNLPRPGRLYMLWRGSHPALADRVDFANRYRPWATGQPLRFGAFFDAAR